MSGVHVSLFPVKFADRMSTMTSVLQESNKELLMFNGWIK